MITLNTACKEISLPFAAACIQSGCDSVCFLGRSDVSKAFGLKCSLSLGGLKPVSKSICNAAAYSSDSDNGEMVGLKLRPFPSELARTLTALCTEGTLSTASAEGWPLASLIQFALDAEGRPILKFLPDSFHSKNTEHDNRCSLNVQFELPGKQKPQCTLKGRLHKPADEESHKKLEIAWQRRFDTGEEIKSEDLWWIDIDQVLVVQDLEEDEVWVNGASYAAAMADPLRDYAAKIVEDMNRLHWEDVRRFCYTYAGIEEEIEEASMTWVDKLGFDLRILLRSSQQLREVRVPFHREVTDDRDARSSIMLMAQTVWERERNYVPAAVPLGNAQPIT